MIRRSEVFDDEALPPDLRHREGQVKDLIRQLHRARETGDEGAMITGPSGVGKTVLGRTVLEEYAHEYGADWTWIQTLGMTTGDIFREAIRGAGDSVADNAPNDELPRRLRDAVDGDLLVLLDEADDLAGTGAVEKLAAEEGVGVVVIVHNPEDWLARSQYEVRQRLHGGRVELSRYGVDELSDILQDRAQVGLVDGAVTREQLETIADDVAGVARDGIQTLRAAAEIAGEREHGRILNEDVDDAYERARRRIRQANLESLPFHHLVLYELIRQRGPITGRELHQLYENLAEEIYEGKMPTPITDRERRTKLQKLREYDLVERERLDHRHLYIPIDPGLTSEVQIRDSGEDSSV